MEIEENVPLSNYTTFHIGGPARYFVPARNREEVRAALAFAHEKNLHLFILGGGSNVLADDAGFDGLVLKIEMQGIELQKKDDAVTLVAGAGESWDSIVERAVKENLWGIENLSGIPGTVGGACVQNIGAYGQALSQTLAWVEALDINTGEVIQLSNKECAFGYRDSFFKHAGSGHVVLRAAFALSPVPQPEVSYKDLKMHFADSSVSLPSIRQAILEIRKGKFPDVALEGTAGSFFKNPIVTIAEAKQLQEKYPLLPLFDMPETSGVKIPLAWFLDARNGALLLQTLRVGGARLYEKQPLVIATQKNTSSVDVKTLAAEVQKQIKEKIGITIEPEVRIL